MTTGEKIRLARINKGLTQAELAERMNVSFPNISKWERDVRKPKVETIVRLAKALDVRFEDIAVLEDTADDRADDDRHELVKIVRCEHCELAMRTEIYERYHLCKCLINGCFVPANHFCGHGK